MPVDPFSRYRDLTALDLAHQTRGRTHCLPIRRPPIPPLPPGSRVQRYAGYQPADLLALKYFKREDLYWYLMDYNDRRLPESLQTGENIIVPAPGLATRVDRNGN